ncbi:hypothetical protein HBH98_251650 [Parastagonospora nodorum]|nr:hypothetical protein HBH53_257630 [Parastagonospora nodorum]KAH3956117.1 hypothetical protein HBH51_254070 [Parastagonospora nodorum]KAH4215373.1 hypothetical protein HBI06_254840 [Parastagonospora nodorum]KAH4223050.1 hypothetical protein HBI05_251670 [Parastagonospora nodorum]KAH4332806.1 hypothetical protein HBH98_251650 [Parastagonospora nodorum]
MCEEQAKLDNQQSTTRTPKTAHEQCSSSTRKDRWKLLRAQSNTADPRNSTTGRGSESECASDSDVDSFYLSDMIASDDPLNECSASEAFQNVYHDMKDVADFVEDVDDTYLEKYVHFEINFEEAVVMEATKDTVLWDILEDETSSEERPAGTST